MQDFKYHLQKEDSQIVNNHMKTCSNSLDFREVLIKQRDTIRNPFNWVNLKRLSITTIDEGVKHWKPFFAAGGNINRYQFGKPF